MPQRRLANPIVIPCLLAAVLLTPTWSLPCSANTWTGPAISTPHDGWTFVPAESIQAWIEQGIAANQKSPPPGNDGPFTKGYKSIVILSGQCYSRGLYSLLGLGTPMIIGAAADYKKKANWFSPPPLDTTKAKWLWLAKLAEELRADPRRPLKQILDAVRAANPDPEANTPAPDFNDDGDTVELGNPWSLPPGQLSYHAVIFAGRLSDRPSPAKEHEDAATRKAVTEMKDVLEAKCGIPANNIRTVYAPATWDSLKNAIKDTWKHMNDNEQFTLVLADHSNSTSEAKQNAWVAPQPDAQEGQVPTEEESADPDAFEPETTIESAYCLVPAVVRFNGVAIGVMSPSPGPTRQTFSFPQSLLAPVGQINFVRVETSLANAALGRLALSTGPVAGQHVNVLPALDWLRAAGLALLMFVAGALALRRRSARAA